MLFEKQLLIKSENGFSLVEVLVAMGIAGVVSLGVMRINQNMIKGQRSAEQRANKLDVQAELSRLIAAQTVCDASLRGLTIDATPPTASTVHNCKVVVGNGGSATNNGEDTVLTCWSKASRTSSNQSFKITATGGAGISSRRGDDENPSGLEGHASDFYSISTSKVIVKKTYPGDPGGSSECPNSRDTAKYYGSGGAGGQGKEEGTTSGCSGSMGAIIFGYGTFQRE